MPNQELTRKTLPLFKQKLQAIRSVEQRKWGSLTPERVMRHLRTSVEVSLGEGPKLASLGIPGIRVLTRYLFFHWFTRWPGGVIKAPAKLTPEAEDDLDAERAALFDALDRFVEALEETPGRTGPNMLLGALTMEQYAQVHGVHFTHHLRQYGVLE